MPIQLPRYLSLLVCLASLAGCGSADGGGNQGGAGPPPQDVNPGLPALASVAPETTGDGWQVSTPDAEGMDAARVSAALQSIRDGQYSGVDSVVVARNGRLIAEGYFNGFGRDSLHDLRSASKSITSALAGIAIDQGHFAVDQRISQYLPRFDSYQHMDDRKRAITVFHLLNMNSGLSCDDADPASPGNEERMYGYDDWVKFILDLPMAHAPGELASYCTGSPVVLGSIIATRSGMGLDAFAAAYLFAPLGIQSVSWRRMADGSATGGGGLRLRPRDAAKFGQLFLDDGVWSGARVVPASWVETSRRRVDAIGRDSYGFLWWKRSFVVGDFTRESFFASGNGGNFVFVIPAEKLVVVFTGSNYNTAAGNQPFSILAEQILPAIR
ncbi:MAG: serine hydrolase [Pseudomonadota bacterium]